MIKDFFCVCALGRNSSICIYVTVSVSVRVCSEGMYFSKHAVTQTCAHTDTHQIPLPVWSKRSAFQFLQTLNQVTKRMCVSVPPSVCVCVCVCACVCVCVCVWVCVSFGNIYVISAEI